MDGIPLGKRDKTSGVHACEYLSQGHHAKHPHAGDHLRCSGHIPQSVFLGQQSGLLDQGTGRSAEQVVHAVAGAKGSSFGTHVEDELRANSGRNRQRTLSVSVISKTGGIRLRSCFRGPTPIRLGGIADHAKAVYNGIIPWEGGAAGMAVTKYLLMNQDTPVLDFICRRIEFDEPEFF